MIDGFAGAAGPEVRPVQVNRAMSVGRSLRAVKLLRKADPVTRGSGDAIITRSRERKGCVS